MKNNLPSCMFAPESLSAQTLAQPVKSGKSAPEPFKTFANESGMPVKILEDTDVSNPPEVHRDAADLWFCIDGEVTFVVDGEITGAKAQVRTDGSINDLEISGASIEGGVTYVLTPGDWLWIPAGQPHMHSSKGRSRLYIIKILQKEVPLDQIPGWKS